MLRPLVVSCALVVAMLGAGCARPDGEVPSDVFGHCIYVNRFADQEECKELRGAGWTDETATAACEAEGAALESGPCPYSETLGACVMPSDDATAIEQRIAPAGEPGDCAGNERGCELFGGGTFVPGSVCGGPGAPDLDDAYDPDDYFVAATQECREVDGDAGAQVCTWSQIGGCTQEDLRFEEEASCETVLTQRPYSPVPPASAPAPDERMRDAAYAADVDWVKTQVEACGCVCCHKGSVAPEGAAIWDIEHGSGVADGNWVDSFTPWGLAFGARAFDSSLLGAYDAADNNGFGRDVAGLPSTDQPRMKAFFERELEHRGYTVADFADEPPAPAVFYEQSIYEPVACEGGEGVADDGVVRWSGGRARYLYVLAVGSANPGVPPNLDVPDGTLWKLDTVPPAIPVKTGEVVYGDVPDGHREVVPDAPLVAGDTYVIYALADVGVPITRCLFVR